MSVDTSIKEGGNPRAFGRVKRLLVEGGDGKYYPWVLLSERQLDSLSVNKNGVYQASKMGVYGWRSVSVNVPQQGSVTGKDPATGKEVTITADPETGELVTEPTPVEIRVIEPPTNPYGIYMDGQTIDKAGMVVKAYDSDGEELMTVPLNQVSISPTTAVFDPEKDTHGGGTATIDASGYEGYNMPLPFTHAAYCVYPAGGSLYPKGAKMEGVSTAYYVCMQYVNPSSGGSATYHYWLSLSPITIDITTYWGDGDTRYTTKTITSTHRTRISGTEFYGDSYMIRFGWGGEQQSPAPHIIAGVADIEKVGTILFDGELDEYPAGSPQTISVSWPRPGDGAILETSFDILVGPRGGGGED